MFSSDWRACESSYHILPDNFSILEIFVRQQWIKTFIYVIITISKGVYLNNTLQGVLAADIFVDVLVLKKSMKKHFPVQRNPNSVIQKFFGKSLSNIAIQ